MKLTESLQNLGLQEKEAQVYIALLQTGRATAYAVARRSGLKKPTTYVILGQLIEKKIAFKVPQRRTMQFVAIEPEELFAMAENRLKNAQKEALAPLQALNKEKSHDTKVSYYEGLSGVRKMYEDFFRENKKGQGVGFYANSRNLDSETKQLFEYVRESCAKDDIKRKGITVFEENNLAFLTKEFQKKVGLSLKAINPKKYDSDVSIEVFKSKIYIFSHKDLQATVIDNPDVAKTMRQIFELIWKQEECFEKLG